jgi:hypothetical protein
MIKDAKTVMSKVSRGCELLRGPQSGWFLFRGSVKVSRVGATAAADAIASGGLVRTDDRSSVCGETWARKST